MLRSHREAIAGDMPHACKTRLFHVRSQTLEPFDKQGFLAAQARQSEAESRARQAVQDLYVKIAEGLTPEERRAFPSWREHRRHPGHNLLDEPDHQAGEPKTR